MPTGTSQPLLWLDLMTADGLFRAGYSSRGLTELRFPTSHAPAFTRGAVTATGEIRRWHRVTTSAVQRILAGRPVAKLPPLDWSPATTFQRRVWSAIRRIPTGKTLSYGAVAEAIGNPGAMRAVGGACGANPIPLLIPCHRVLAAGGKLGGFSGGLDWKRTLLAREGVVPSHRG